MGWENLSILLFWKVWKQLSLGQEVIKAESKVN